MASDDRAGETERKVRIRVLIADDHALVRQGLRALLLDAGGVEVVGEARDGREAVAETERLTPDVVLMDVLMPGMDGAEATAGIRAGGSRARVLALSGSDAEARILAALRAGALGYVSKSASRAELIDAIRRVRRGQAAMPAEMTRRLLESFEPATSSEPLTERETEILRLMSSGFSNRQIAGRAGVSEGTVRTHLSHIFDKLGVNNRVEATLCALRDGLTTVDDCLRRVI